MLTSIENDRQLNHSSQNPFTTEIPLYEKDWHPGDIHASVVVPDFYRVALPNLGHQMVEQQINQQAGFFADRTYLTDEFKLLKEHPTLKPDVVFVSMSYEGSYIRSLRALDLLGIPLRREDRESDDPLVVFGGWSVSRNPLPFFDIADVIGIGDSENIVNTITQAFRDHRESRETLYNQLTTEKGVIVPDIVSEQNMVI